jgi:hypothetical protein
MSRQGELYRRIVLVVQLAGSRGMTSAHVARTVRCSVNYAAEMLRSAVANQDIHIKAFERSERGSMKPVYAFGPQTRPSEKPAPLTRMERFNRHVTRHGRTPPANKAPEPRPEPVPPPKEWGVREMIEKVVTDPANSFLYGKKSE